MTSCPSSESSTMLDSGGVTVVAVTASAGSCATGWYSCGADVGGGCCPSGYACGSSCTATATSSGSAVAGVTGSSVAKEAVSGAVGGLGWGVVWMVGVGVCVGTVGLM